jgi:hypothetical protein
MVTCSLILNNLRFTKLVTDVGRFTAFSGDGKDRNNPSSESVRDGGPIPLGLYHIVDRPSGGRLGAIRDAATGRFEWFALYRDDGTIDDETFVDSVKRGQFRLHPLGPLGMSTGCVVLQYRAEFNSLRSCLLAAPVANIPGTSMRTYGTIDVVQLEDTLDPRYRQTPPRQGTA